MQKETELIDKLCSIENAIDSVGSDVRCISFDNITVKIANPDSDANVITWARFLDDVSSWRR